MIRRPTLANLVLLAPALLAACSGGGVRVGPRHFDAAAETAAETATETGAEATEAGAPCAECTLWEPGSCGAGRACQQSNDGAGLSCVRCTAPGNKGSGAPCSYNSDCVAGYGCADGVCRQWCAAQAAPGAAGACARGELCSVYHSLEDTGAGLCLPCGECDPTSRTCPGGQSCSTSDGCAAFHGIGSSPEGGACAGHSDCACGLSCVSRVCRAGCVAGAKPGEAGACPGSTDASVVSTCDAAPGSRTGDCLPCGECDLFSPSCRQGFKCVPRQPGCTLCLPTGTATAGAHCTDHSQCQAGLFCVDDVCRQYCLPSAQIGEPGACGSGSCVELASQPGLGMCLPCGECSDSSAAACRSGFSCGSYGTCRVCAANGPLDPGSFCADNNDCASLNCVDGVCRALCSATGQPACGADSRCLQISTTDGETLGLCYPCGECDVLAQTGCRDGFKCIADRRDCSVCYPGGDRQEGQACQGISECAAPLNCANGVCLPYCDVRDPATCAPAPKRCFGSSASLPTNVGTCLPCGGCVPWSADSCSPELQCNEYSGCVVCEGSGGSRSEGATCVLDGDCVRDHHCINGVCRHYCMLGAAGGNAGTCPADRRCVAGDSYLASLNAGLCLP